MGKMDPETWIYLHAAMQQLAAKVNDKTFVKTVDPSKVKKEKERLNEIKRRLQYGRAWWVLVAVTVIADAAMIVVLLQRPPTTYIYAAPVDKWRVIEQVSDYEFILQNVHNGNPQVAMYRRFCSGPAEYKPRFQIGMTLIWFAYDERGDCMSIAAKDLGYVIERKADHWPTLADNCTNLGLGKPVVCDGLPYWKGK